MSRKKKEQNLEEENKMENDFMTEEMTGTEEMGTEVPATEAEKAAEAADTRIWKDASGAEVSKSAFIREQFLTNNKSRKNIADEFAIPYRTVYGATVNMVNEAEPSTRGRGVTNSKIQVTADGKVYTTAEGKYFLNGEEIIEDEAAAIVTTETDRNEYIKAQVAAGVDRGEVAKNLGLSYGVIYGLTKDAEGGRVKHEVTLADGTVVSRSEYIRMQVAAGVKKGDIAKELGVEYSVVWQATKKDKTEAEKVEDIIANLEKFRANLVNPELLDAAIEALKVLEFKAEEVKEEAPKTEIIEPALV